MTIYRVSTMHAMKKGKNTLSVTLRQRVLKSGNTQQYLYIYVDGEERYESLGSQVMILKDDKLSIKKDKMRLAEAIRAKREEELKCKLYGFEQNMGDIRSFFFPYFDKLMTQKSKASKLRWASSRQHILIYCKDENLRFMDISREWVEGFKTYLLEDAENQSCILRRKRWDEGGKRRAKTPPRIKKIKIGTARNVFTILVECLKEAVKEGILPKNPAASVKGIYLAASVRNYLTEEELKKLSNTPTLAEVVKRAFLFSCMTGLRYSDIVSLRWNQISNLGNGRYRLAKSMVKTTESLYLDLNNEAVRLLGEIRKDDGRVFEGMYCPRGTCYALERWCKEAGVNKKITFHSARHTHAVLLLTKDVDLYTVSKLLGHTNIKTTEVYAHIVDKMKQSAVDKLNDIL